jgi:hypothetical protein
MMSNWTPHSRQVRETTAANIETLLQEINRLIKVNIQLTQDSMTLRSQVVDLLHLNLSMYTGQLEQSNQELLQQVNQQQASNDREIAQLQKAITSLQDLVAHQHAQLKQAFQAGMVGKAQAQE